MATTTAPAEQRVVLSNISWETYEGLVADNIDQSAPRLTYDRGTLEIMSPGSGHEKINRSLARLVWIVALELGVELDDVGSMTYKRAHAQRGFEPDSSFYVRTPGEVALDREIDPETDPPPDLVIEIDVSRSSVGKLDVFASLGVPEAWVWEDDHVTFFVLDGGSYRVSSNSLALPAVSAESLAGFFVASRTLSNTEWYRSVVAWARSL